MARPSTLTKIPVNFPVTVDSLPLWRIASAMPNRPSTKPKTYSSTKRLIPRMPQTALAVTRYARPRDTATIQSHYPRASCGPVDKSIGKQNTSHILQIHLPFTKIVSCGPSSSISNTLRLQKRTPNTTKPYVASLSISPRESGAKLLTGSLPCAGLSVIYRTWTRSVSAWNKGDL